MGIILGALAGAADNVNDYLDKSIAQDQKLQQINAQSNVDLMRQEALEQFKLTMADQQRNQMVQRVQGAAGNIADQQMAPVVQQEQAGIVDPSSWTPEQQAAVDQSNGLQRQGLIQQAITDGSAGLATGDINPEKAMENTSRIQINSLKTDNMLAIANLRGDVARDVGQARWEAYSARTQSQYDAAMAKMEAMLAKAGSGGTDFDKKVKLLKDSGATPKDIANFILERKQPSLEDLAGGFLRSDPNAGGKKAMTPAEALEKARTLRSLTQSLDAGPAPAPAPSAAPGIGGAPYPEGTQLTGPGGAPYIVKNGQPVPLQ